MKKDVVISTQKASIHAFVSPKRISLYLQVNKLSISLIQKRQNTKKNKIERHWEIGARATNILLCFFRESHFIFCFATFLEKRFQPIFLQFVYQINYYYTSKWYSRSTASNQTPIEENLNQYLYHHKKTILFQTMIDTRWDPVPVLCSYV